MQALQGLTGRWRQKVFSLLVQMQELRQEAEYEAQRRDAEKAESSRELDRSRGVIAQLELKLSAAQAELCEERALLEVRLLYVLSIKPHGSLIEINLDRCVAANIIEAP